MTTSASAQLPAGVAPNRGVGYQIGRSIIVGVDTVVFLAILVGASIVIAGWIGVVYLFFLGLLTLSAFAFSRRELHRRRVAAVMTTCATGIRLGLPLPEFLRGQANAERGHLRKRLLHIADRLALGIAPGRALVESLPELDRRQQILLLAADSTDTTPHALERFVQENTPTESDPTARTTALLIYAAWSLLVVSVVCWTILLFVTPKFDQIIRDFGIRAPQEPLASLYGLYVIGGAAGVIAVLWLSGAIFASLLQRKGTIENLRGGSPPWLGRSRRQRVDLYNLLADTIDAGRPLAELTPWLAASGDEDGVALITQLSRGADVASAARASSVPSTDAALLATAAGTRQLPAALRFLAENHARIHEARRRLIHAVASLGVMALVATLTIPPILAIWRPMILLISAVQESFYRVRY